MILLDNGLLPFFNGRRLIASSRWMGSRIQRLNLYKPSPGATRNTTSATTTFLGLVTLVTLTVSTEWLFHFCEDFSFHAAKVLETAGRACMPSVHLATAGYLLPEILSPTILPANAFHGMNDKSPIVNFEPSPTRYGCFERTASRTE